MTFLSSSRNRWGQQRYTCVWHSDSWTWTEWKQPALGAKWACGKTATENTCSYLCFQNCAHDGATGSGNLGIWFFASLQPAADINVLKEIFPRSECIATCPVWLISIFLFGIMWLFYAIDSLRNKSLPKTAVQEFNANCSIQRYLGRLAACYHRGLDVVSRWSSCPLCHLVRILYKLLIFVYFTLITLIWAAGNSSCQ